MSLPPEADAQLPLKKRARRRLVGAIALAVLAAVVLPMVMDQAPQTPVADVQIRIPGQDQVPAFVSKAPAAKAGEAARPAAHAEPVAVAPSPAAAVAPAPAKPEKPVDRPADKPVTADKAADKPSAKSPEKSPEKPAEKAPAKTPEKTPEKAADKSHEKVAEKSVAAPAEKLRSGDDDSRRAAAILSGKPGEASAATGGGQFVVLIGAFANPANVKQLQAKLGEVGVKTYTEPLDSPQGKKTRVRAGPFPNRDAADKALEKMKRIGVNGVVAAKQ